MYFCVLTVYVKGGGHLSINNIGIELSRNANPATLNTKESSHLTKGEIAHSVFSSIQ